MGLCFQRFPLVRSLEPPRGSAPSLSTGSGGAGPEPASFTFPRSPSPHQPWVLPGPAGPLHFSLALKRAAAQPPGAGGLPGAEGSLAFPQRPKRLPAKSVLAAVGAGPSDMGAPRPLRHPSQPLSQPRPQGTSLWAGPCAPQFLEPVRLPKGPAQRYNPGWPAGPALSVCGPFPASQAGW